MNDFEINNNQSILVTKIIDASRIEAVDFMVEIAKEVGYFAAINQVLEPALIEIGEMWSKEKLSLAQGYVAAKITEDVLLKALETKEWQSKIAKNHTIVVLANIEDDFHSLGRKMVSTFLKASGWEVCDMGNDITAFELVNKAVELNAPIIGVSAMMYTSALNIKKVRHEIDNRKLQNKIKLAVGGAIFKVRPELVHEVGGDGTVASAMQVPQLFSELLKLITPA
jgi:methylmalonyl-CoA mutase cobalamin-binding domain/chain